MSQINNIGGGGGGGGGTVISLTGNSGGPVGPDDLGNINVVGSGGVNVSGDAGDNTLTITVSGAGFSWTDEATSFNAAAENAYFCTAALTANLPASPDQGDTVIINTVTSSSVVIQANTGQTIVIGSGSSTVAGTATSAVSGNSLTLVYRATGSTWRTISSPQGTWSLA